MSDLDISTVDLTGTAKAVTVNVDLVDSTGTKLAGTVTATGASVVVPMAVRTDADGLLTLDLVPNADITPANTYYAVRIKGTTWLISKGEDSETILEALVADPSPLAPAALAVVNGRIDVLDADLHGGVLPRNMQESAMRTWLAALANRDTTPARAIICGDSITEGWTVTGAATHDLTYVGHARRVVASRLNPNGRLSRGYVPGHHGVIGNPKFSNVGGSKMSNYGIALMGQVVPAGQRTEITVTCDRFEIHYPRQNLFMTAPRIYIDDVLVATLSDAIDTSYPSLGGEGTFVWDSGPLERGSHVIGVQAGGSAECYFEGALFYDGNFSSGVSIINGGHFGYKYGGGASNKFNGTRWLQGVAGGRVMPHLVVGAHGANQSAQTVAEFRETIETWISEVRAAVAAGGGVAPSIALMVPWRRSDAVTQEKWESFRSTIYAVAREQNCAVFDWWQLTGSVGAADADDPMGLAVDTVHANNKGHKMIGEAFGAWLIDSVGYDGTTQLLSVDTAQLADGAVTAPKIASSAVTSGKINTSAVTTAKVDDLAITTAKLADLATTTAKLAASAVTADKIGDSAVTTAKINDLAITTAKYAALSITGGKINLGAVANNNLANMSEGRMKGRADGAGTGQPNDLTAAEVAAIVSSAGTLQPIDSDLTAIAALSTTAYGRSLLELADAAAGRTALALGSAATASTGDFAAAGSGTTKVVSAVTGPTVVESTAETSLWSQSIAGAAAGDVYRLILFGDYLNASGGASTSTWRIKLGATTVLTSNANSLNSGADRRVWRLELDVVVGTLAQQIVSAFLAMGVAVATNLNFTTTDNNGSGFAASAEDLTTAKTLDVTHQHSVNHASTEIVVKGSLLTRLR